jgi:hypothetical protein
MSSDHLSGPPAVMTMLPPPGAVQNGRAGPAAVRGGLRTVEQRKTEKRLCARLRKDETAFSSLDVVVAGLALVLGGLVAFRAIAGIVASIAYRVHLLLTLMH